MDVMKNIESIFKPYWTKTTLFWSVLGFSWIVFWWDLYLDLRQYNVYKTTKKVPKELEDVLDHETFIKSKNYSIDKAKFSLIAKIWSQLQSTIILYFYLMPYFWDLSRKIMISYMGFTPMQENEIVQTLVFILVTTLMSTIIDLPLSLYNTFVLEQQHGFNNQTLKFYAWDKLKKFVVSYAILAPITATVIYIVRTSGPYFFVYLWVFCSATMLVLMFFQAEIAALFDTFTPLQDGNLRDKINELAGSVKFPLSNIFVVDGSKRSGHSNAYFTGMFNRKRIVLYDTLIEGYPKSNTTSTDKDIGKDKKGCTTEEIIAVLAHELGHWMYNHLIKNLALAQVNLFLMFLLFSKLYVNTTLYEAFGYSNDKPVVIGLTLMMMILTPYNEIQGFITILLSRKYEYQADGFAQQLGHAEQLKKALVKLSNDNLGFPVYDDLYSEFNHSHPTLIQRLRALEKSK